MLNVDFSFVRLSGHDIPFLLMDVTLRKRGREIFPPTKDMAEERMALMCVYLHSSELGYVFGVSFSLTG